MLIRGQKVVLDVKLAELYSVTTKAFNQAVKRNIDRFPKDFMFQLTPDEALTIRSQFVTASGANRGKHAENHRPERIKIEINEAKYPVEKAKGSGRKYNNL